MAKNGLIYSNMSKALLGVPARDLSNNEVLKHGGYDALLASGLYEEPKRKAKKKSEVKDGSN